MNELRKIKDHELLNSFSEAISQERQSCISVILHLAEIDRRRLYAQEGYASLFGYMTEKYHYCGGSAYRRIQAARLSLRFPKILDFIKNGRLNLTTLCLIAPHIHEENKESVIEKVVGKSKKEVEYLISSLFETRAIRVEDKIIKLPQIKKRIEVVENTASASGCKTAQKEAESPEPAFVKKEEMPKQEEAEQRVKIEFSANETLAKKIQRAKDLLRHKYPKARLEEIFDEALEALLEKRDPERKIARMSSKLFRRKSAQSDSKPESKPLTRYIPQEIRRIVWKRDHGRCAYQSPNGRKCGEKAFLEVDHVSPFALGGKSMAENLQLLCHAHNQYRAQQTFGVIP